MMTTSYRQRILRVMLHMEEQINRPEGADAAQLTLEHLAGVACLSPFHFHRVFTGMVGESVMAYLRRLRLERAATAMSFTGRSVMDVALDCGYETPEAFSRAFRKRFGQSPQQFRAKGTQRTPDNPYVKESIMPNNMTFSPEALGLEVSIRTLPSLRVAAVRHVGPYNLCYAAWQTLCDWAGPANLLRQDTQYLSLCHDDPTVTAPDNIRCDVCVTLPEGAVADGPATELTVPGGEYAVALHKGPYENLYAAYAALCGQWIPASRREMAVEPSVEVYLNSPEHVAPQDLLTEIRIRLAR